MAGITQYSTIQTPKQDEIVEGLRGKMLSGELAPAAKLPSVARLAHDFQASKDTVQRAMEQLRQLGFVVTQNRSGNFVADNPPHLSRFGLVFHMDPNDTNYLAAWQREAELFNQNVPADGLRREISIFSAVRGPSTIEDHFNLVRQVEENRLAGLIFPFPPYAFLGSPVLEAPGLPRVHIGSSTLRDVHTIGHAPSFGHVASLIRAHQRKHVAFITSAYHAPSLSWYIDHLIGESARHGLVTHRHWIHGVELKATGWALTCAELLMRLPRDDRPEALVIMDDNLVPDATAGLAASGVSVPDDLLVVAHANFPHVTPSMVPARRYGPNISDILALAVEIIEKQRRGEEVPRDKVAKCYLDDQVQSN